MTTKTQYTPGPWMLIESTDARNRGYIRPGPLEAAICKVTETGRRKEYHANARLIAAAPELLEAARKIRGTADFLSAAMSSKNAKLAEAWAEVSRILSGPIAKAEGI